MNCLTEVSLRATDYERVFAVLDRCVDVRTVPEFRTRIAAAMTDVFPVRVATCFVGDSYDSQFTDPDAALVGGHGWSAIVRSTRRSGPGTTSSRPPRPVAGSNTTASRRSPIYRTCPPVRPPTCGTIWRLGPALGQRDAPGSAGRARALVGLFDGDDSALGTRDLATLRLLARHLSALTRNLETAPRRDPYAALTERQRDVARLVADGMSNAAIARRLMLAEDTVKKYVSRILAATGCASRTQLALEVQSFGPPAT